MTFVIPCSISSVALIPATPFISRKNNRITRFNFLRKSSEQTSFSHKLFLPLSRQVSLFPKFRHGFSAPHGSRCHILAAAGTEVAIEEPDSSIAAEDADGTSDVPSSTVEASEAPSPTTTATPDAQSKRTRSSRKSEMPPVKNEDLVPGATFTGKVRSIQPFGAFVDFGAFTDGLVHVSRLSDSFVKDVAKFVSVGQEVKVRLVEANIETGRISLTMRDSDDIDKLQQWKDVPAGGDKQKPPRRSATKSKRDGVQKTSKFVKGQDLEGTVKNLTRAGAFISLPEGEEGFLPTAEEADEGFGNIMGGSSLQVGQEVSVRVLRITKGQVTLTMKKEEGADELNSKLSQGVVHTATNPFVLAFRKNKDIAAFLDEREKVQQSVNTSVVPDTLEGTEKRVYEAEDKSDVPEVQDRPTSNDGDQVDVPSVENKVIEEDKTSSEEGDEKEDIVDQAVEEKTTLEEEVEAAATTVDTENMSSNLSQVADTADETIREEQTPETSSTEASLLSEEASVADSEKEDNKSDTAGEVTAGQISSVENVASGVVETQADETIVEDKVQAQTSIAEENETPAEPSEDDNVPPTPPDKNGSVTTSSGQAEIPPSKETSTTISPALVKQLREETGAGMMDCKKALAETGGDIVKAQEFLRKKGLASADKKASRVTAEGRIGSYIHDSRIGVLIEVNCETDFVARGDIFKELVDDLAMQVAACPQVQCVVTDDIPEEIVNKEREIEMQKEDLLSKPEQIRSKIVEGRIRKRLEELALLEQPYIKNDKVAVKDWVKQTIATIGENIKVKRFVRYSLGEGLEKKSQDFAAEVAAQTAAKSLPVVPEKEQPDADEAKETVQKPPTVTVSAALVMQLREETGAGMMDCKKALSETGGNLEKAREYLRKKGLSSADKKSSRLAAEGRIGSYVHDSRIGVLIEVNCETDFVGRSEKFKELVDDLAMQVAACPQVQVVSVEDIPESVVNKEKELEMQREDLQSKPENIRERIVEGRVAKRLGELALLEQPFIKNDSVLVKDLVKQTIAALGENIKVRRFARFTLGEEIEEVQTET
ncbi:PREDICTED: uncharacterized protein LOC104592125 isoform X2 [Nelumbo nucifera]|uniref:Elongation factor Ts, mitochondrial n=1 Tax=Nelumbo nucifera TaxID=4432 RepID=A0A1U7Z897_NELNU|nr:PREDICTED: uncharacterized protein LOC104592125 isoform X2 [Nelumbo nucifera]